MNTFAAPAILIVGAPTKDGGMRLRIETQELTDEEKLTVLRFNNTFGHFLFKENDFQNSDIPQGNADMKGKSPSQRLRAVMYLIFKESGWKAEDFADYYNEEYEKIIAHYKGKIGT